MLVAVVLCKFFCTGALAILLIYAARDYLFALIRLGHESRDNAGEFAGHFLPSLSVLVPMHNEERVAPDVLQALVNADYPPERLQILAINDRSTDRTGQIINSFAAQYPIIEPVHRTSGLGNKASALEFAGSLATGDILLFFDADYVPGKSLLQFLVAPFIDASVGAVMGRVVPLNTGDSILASLISQERAAGYQVQQQARQLLGLTPQFGGTVGGIRRSALRSVGGWNTASLTEDTDMTCRLMLRGWRIAYVNRAECYEEVPRAWRVRRRQLIRWITGHTECFHTFAIPILRCPHLSLVQKLDTFLMLGQYWTAPLIVTAWLAALLLLCVPGAQPPLFCHGIALVVAGQMFGNQASFVQIGSAAVLDGSGRQARLLPLQLLNFFACTFVITETLARFYLLRYRRSQPGSWHKTPRSRQLLIT